jgi:hypothetical protein
MADDQDQPVVVKVDNLPVQRNWRTNVIGRMLTGDISFNISLDPIFDGEENYPDTLEEELLFAAANGGEVTFTEGNDVNGQLAQDGMMIKEKINGVQYYMYGMMFNVGGTIKLHISAI